MENKCECSSKKLKGFWDTFTKKGYYPFSEFVNWYHLLNVQVSFLILFLFVCNSTTLKAQVSGYVFTQSINTYTTIPSPITIFSPGWDDAIIVETLPFNFNYNGVNYTSCNVSSNGFITLGTTASGVALEYNPISGTASYDMAIAAFGRNLIGNTSTIVKGVTGASPNRVFSIQWNNVQRILSGVEELGDVLNFQIRLYETSNKIELMYGSCTTTSTTNTGKGEVGLRGTSNTDFNNRAGGSETLWASTIAGVLNDDTINFKSTVVPVSGLTFTWIPSPVIPNDNCSGASTLTVDASAITGDVSGATESFVTPCAGIANDDVWYSFTTSTAGNYKVTAVGSSLFDAVLELRSGPCIGTNLYCADTSGNGSTEQIYAFGLAASTTYYIRIYDREDDVPSTTSFTIAVALLPAPTITSFNSAGCMGSSLVITGTNLGGISSVSIGGTPVTIISNTATSVTVNVNSATSGYIAIIATNGSVTSTAPFSVLSTPTTFWAAETTPVCYSTSSQTTHLAYSATTNMPISYSIVWDALPSNSFVNISDASFAGTPTGGTINTNIPASTASGIYSGTITVKSANGCESLAVQKFSVVVNSPPPTTTGVSICQGGVGSVVASSACSGFFNAGISISGTWAATPIALRPATSITNSPTCSFHSSVTRNYVATNFQVAVTGYYIFEMNNDTAFDGMGYITTSDFVPGNCLGGGSWIVGDDDSGAPGSFEPRVSATLTAGVTYTLISTTYSGTSGTYIGDFTWSITPPIGGQIMLFSSGIINWYTSASGGSPIGTGSPFNPVGVAGSGLTDTNTAGTTTFYAACSNNTLCRTATNFVINTNVTYYQDADNDTFGNPEVAVHSCTGAPMGYVAIDSDCDDTNAAIHPGAIDACYDGIDNDCNGIIDNVGLPGGCIPKVSSLIPSLCGATISGLNATISATFATGAQGFRFRVTKVDIYTNAPLSTPIFIDRPVANFSLSSVLGVSYHSKYLIEVSVKYNNVYQPFYSVPCYVTIGNPVANVAQCSTTLSMMNQWISSSIVPQVGAYKFRVNQLNSSGMPVGASQEFVSSIARFNMTQFIGVLYNTNYSVEVSLRNTDMVYLPYNAPCTITTPAHPTTQIKDSQCTDYAVVNKTENIYADLVTAAVEYRFRVYLLDASNAVVYDYAYDSLLNRVTISNFPGLLSSTTYAIQVAVKMANQMTFGPYGNVCSLVTPGASRSVVSDKVLEITTIFEAIAYPNPFTENIQLEVKTNNEADLEIRVYDMIGKIVEQKTVIATDIQTLAIGVNYPSGVYNVIISQGDVFKTLRVIKR